MAAFDAGYVDEPRRAADQRAAWKDQLRHGLKAAFRDSPRAVGDTPPALQHRPDERMCFEALEFVEGREIGMGVIQMDDEADGGKPFAVMIKERSSTRVIVERPAHAVHHQTGAMLLGRKFP